MSSVDGNTPAISIDGSSSVSSGDLPVIYKYQPLDKNIDSIRLLVLHPRRDDEDHSIVRCELVHTTFRQKPSYEALSYTWGDEKTAYSIHLDGCPVAVRENLYTALHDLRWIDKTRILWADAICIDQSNFEERQYQVGLMDYIYTRAPVVLIWLDHWLDHGRCVPSFRRTMLKEWALWVCHHPYWKRLWIIQEICLSRKLSVCIGSDSVVWETFIHDLSKLSQKGVWQEWELQEYNNGFKLIENLHLKRLGRHSNRLETLLADFQYAQCSEIRDKIYGFLGLVYDCKDVIVADYSKPLYNLYSDVIRFFCRRRLLQNGAVNDLDRAMRIVKFSQLLQRILRTSYKEAITSSADRTSLTAKGAEVGRISQILPSYDEACSSSQANSKWHASSEGNHTIPQDTAFRREANDAYLGTLLDLQTHDLEKISNVCWDDLQDRFWSYARVLKGNWNNKPEDWDHKNSDERIDDVDPNQRILAIPSPLPTDTGPRIFLGSNFLMGLVPSDARVGDIVCQFWETDVAALLRSEGVEGSDDTVYRVIGRVHLCTGTLEYLRPVYKPWNPIAERADSILIRMDLDTLSFLTC